MELLREECREEDNDFGWVTSSQLFLCEQFVLMLCDVVLWLTEFGIYHHHLRFDDSQNFGQETLSLNNLHT